MISSLVWIECTSTVISSTVITRYQLSLMNKALEEGIGKEEDVAPGVQFHGCDAELGDSNETCGEQSTEGSCERTGRDEDSDAEQEFVPLVEARQEECNAGHGTALSETEESASNVQSGVCLDECCAHRAEAEGEDQEWDPESRTDGLEDDV